MNNDLTGKRVTVTGAGAGIGAAVARAFATAGAHVTVADINSEAAQRVADEIAGTPWVVDLSDTAALAELRLGCDVLVNNAGIQHVSPVESFPPEKFRLILTLMLEAPFLLIRAALPHMYAQGTAGSSMSPRCTASSRHRSSLPTSPRNTVWRGCPRPSPLRPAVGGSPACA